MASGARPQSPQSMSQGGLKGRAKLTGTFTDLSYHAEGGDVLGTEIRIVAGRHGLQATIQEAEGSPSDLVLVPKVVATVDGRIRFDVPVNELDIRHFEGVITPAQITGVWTLTDGTTERVVLKRGRSYWE
jgi:hypothetical protein